MMSTLFPRFRTLAACVLFACLAGCVTNPNIVSKKEVSDRVDRDFSQMFSETPDPGANISLEEAIARALKYNLDNRLKLMEAVVAQQRLDLLDFKKLPQLAANAGYTVRSRRQASSSLNLGTGVPNFGSSTSQDLGILSADLQLSWDTLDFGIAYLNAKQASDEVMIATERQRKTVQNIIRDVRYAYWRLQTVQSLQDDLPPLLEEIKLGLNDSYAAQQAKLKPIEECLDYQRAMLDIQRQMHGLQREINNARIELTALIGLPPGFDYEVSGSFNEIEVETFDGEFDSAQLQRIALENRPELIEEDYKKRIALQEVKKARLRMIPGIELFTGYNYNDNSFLLHDTWAASGYRLTWDLLNLISGPRAIRHAKAQTELADIRRMATSMAVLTQVDIATHRLQQAETDYRLAKELNRVDSSLYEEYQKRQSFDQIDQLTVVQSKARNLLSNLRHAAAFTDWQDAISQLRVSVGYQPAVVLNHNADLNDLTLQVRDYLQAPVLTKEEGLYTRSGAKADKETASEYKQGEETVPRLSKVNG